MEVKKDGTKMYNMVGWELDGLVHGVDNPA